MYIIVRFFSLLFCLFLLKRVAKRERERRTREKQPTATLCCCCCLNYCTWRGDFSNSLWWRCQFEYEENRIPWKKTFRILSLLTLSYSKLIKLSLLRGASFFRFFRESVVRRITAFRRLYWVLLLLVVLLYHWRPPTLPPTGRERGERIFVSFFASFFFFLPARKKGQSFSSLSFFLSVFRFLLQKALCFFLSLFFFFCQQSVVFAFFSFSLSSCLSLALHIFFVLCENTHTHNNTNNLRTST